MINENILSELRKPFHPTVIEFKPGATKDGKALGLFYADPRAYQNRLDEVCGMDWSVTFTPWGDRIVCHVTINGVTRSSTGEGDSQSEKSEIAGTAAEAQAFKRACSMFGLGRYLYEFPAAWAEFDPAKKRFTAQGEAALNKIVFEHYRRNSAEPEQKQAQATEKPEVSDELRKMFHEAGVELYADKWAEICKHNVERITKGKTTDPIMLTSEQIQNLINGMNEVKRKRQHANGATVGK